MRIHALQHVSIRSRDLARARDFYERLLGHREVPRPNIGFPGAWYGIGTNQLHLIAREKLLEGIDPTDPHFALEVEVGNPACLELTPDGLQALDLEREVRVGGVDPLEQLLACDQVELVRPDAVPRARKAEVRARHLPEPQQTLVEITRAGEVAAPDRDVL